MTEKVFCDGCNKEIVSKWDTIGITTYHGEYQTERRRHFHKKKECWLKYLGELK